MYGPGLSDLAPTGTKTLFGSIRRQPSASADPTVEGATVNPDGTWTINGVVVNTTDPRSMVLGMVSALQYNNQTWGQCFYTTTATLSFTDYFSADLTDFLDNGNYYNLMVYDPIRFISNLLACYQ